MGNGVEQTRIVAQMGEDIEMALTTIFTRSSRLRRDRTYQATTQRIRRTQTEPPEMWRNTENSNKKVGQLPDKREVALNRMVSEIPLHVDVLNTPVRK